MSNHRIALFALVALVALLFGKPIGIAMVGGAAVLSGVFIATSAPKGK